MKTDAPPRTVPSESTTRDRLTHIVRDREKVRRAMVEGFPVEALCGKVWVPRRWKPADGVRCQVCEALSRQWYPHSP